MADVIICSETMRKMIGELLQDKELVYPSLEILANHITLSKPFSSKKIKILQKILNDNGFPLTNKNLLKNIIFFFLNNDNTELITIIENNWRRFGGKNPPNFLSVGNFIEIISKEALGISLRSIEGVLCRIKHGINTNDITCIFGFPQLIKDMDDIRENFLFESINNLWKTKIAQIGGFKGILSIASNYFYKDNVATILDIPNRLSKEQIEFIDDITLNMKSVNSFIRILNAPTGAGKSLIQSLLFNKLLKEKYILIYSSASSEVRRNQASLLIGNGMKYFDGSSLNTFSFEYESNCFTYIVHPEQVDRIVTEYSDKKILLSIDEPDFGASLRTDDFITTMNVIQNTNVHGLILSSATIPITPNFMTFIQRKYKNVKQITWKYRIPNKLMSGMQQVSPLADTFFQRFIEPSMIARNILEYDIDVSLKPTNWNLDGIFSLYENYILPKIDLTISDSVMDTSKDFKLWMGNNIHDAELALVICSNPLQNALSSFKINRIKAYKELNEIDKIPTGGLLNFIHRNAIRTLRIIENIQDMDLSHMTESQRRLKKEENERDIEEIRLDYFKHIHAICQFNPILTNDMFDIADIISLCSSLLDSTHPATNNILLLGLMGIAVIQEDLHEYYVEFVREHIGDLFSVLFVGREWIFGVNIDPSITYLDDDLTLSPNEFIQAAGRSGRGTRNDCPGMVFASSGVIQNVFDMYSLRTELPDYIAINDYFDCYADIDVLEAAADAAADTIDAVKAEVDTTYTGITEVDVGDDESSLGDWDDEDSD